MKIRAFLSLFLLSFSLTLFSQNIVEPHLTVMYWPNKGSPFGHVALNVVNSKEESVYLSYAMGNNLKRDLSNLGQPHTVDLPLKNSGDFEAYKTWWHDGPFWHLNPKYGQAYNFLRFNCAHAISNALKFLSYNTGWSDRHFALRPKQVWKKAKSFKQKSIRKSGRSSHNRGH